MTPISLTITGQCCSGKNAMQVTRDGKHYPKDRFKIWRERAMWQLKKQIKGLDLPIDHPVSVYIKYWAGDSRRRDIPGLVDALWHLLEKMGIVTDDSLLGGEEHEMRFYNLGVDRARPRVEIELL